MTRDGFLYVIEAENGRIKIGWSQRPEARARAVHSLSPVRCRLVAAWAGTRQDEIALHALFSEHRDHCEWFRIEGPICPFLDSVFGRGCNVEPWGGLKGNPRNQSRINQIMSEKMRQVWAVSGYKESILAARGKAKRARMVEPPVREHA